MRTRIAWRRRWVLVFVWVVMGGGVRAREGSHRISFTFNYDFRSTPACSKKLKAGCVEKFNIYDISVGIDKRTMLGSIAVPAHARGMMKGIRATTEPIEFNAGKHLLAVAAVMADGSESDLRKCETIVEIS
jgi:hypothetical protein